MPITFKNTIADDIKKARAEGNKTKANALELLAGGISTGVGVVTGIPDIAIAGYNYLNEKRAPKLSELVTGKPAEIKDLRSRILESGGFPTEATTPEGTIAYNVPEIAAGIYGLASLAKSAWKFLKDKKNTKKITDFLGELPSDTQNIFKKYMMTGQGSDDPVIVATLQKLKTNPNYSELFTTLEKAATDAALKNMDVVSNTSKTKTAERIITAVNNKIENTTKDALEAGSKLYDKANKIGNGRRIVSTEKTLAEVRKLIAEYSKMVSPSSENAVKFLRDVESRLVPSFTTEARAGTTIKGATEPSRVIPGAPTTTQTVQVPVSYIDDLGMTRTRMETKTITSPSRGSTTISGTTEPTRVIPGAPSTTISQGAKNLTTEEVRSLLTEFGKKASGGDTLLKDVSLSDEKRISSAIFGNLKDDLRESAKLATNVDDKSALNILQAARTQTKDAYQNLSNLTAQGIPKFLQGKSMNEISFDDLQKAYVDLNPRQRAIFRKHVKTSDPEALKTLDKSIYEGFVSKHKTELPDGTFGVDLGSLARAWAKEDNLSLNDRNMIAYSMGQNFTEFDKRMKDALVFTRKMSVGGVPVGEASALGKATRSVPAVVGAASNYPAAKGTEVGLDIIDALKNKGKLTDDMLMKALITPEGKDFLKNAAMSAPGKKRFEELMKGERIRPSNTGLAATTTAISGLIPATEQPEEEYIPTEGLFNSTQPSLQNDYVPSSGEEYVPTPGIYNEQTPVTGPTNKAEAAMAAEIGTPQEMAQQQQQYYKPLYEGLRGDISSGAYAPQPEEMNFLRRAGLVQ